MFYLFFTAALVAMTGCSKYYYNPAPQILPQYIRKIAVRPFANHTNQYTLEDKLTLAVQSQFNQDGRYQITTEDQADGVVIGDITKYILEPLAFDENHVPTLYKLWILVDVTFYDKIRNQTLWQEKNLEGIVTYYSASSNQPTTRAFTQTTATSSGQIGNTTNSAQTGTTNTQTPVLTEVEAQQQIWDLMAKDITTRTFEGFGTVTGASDKEVPKSSPEQYNAIDAPGQPASGASRRPQ